MSQALTITVHSNEPHVQWNAIKISMSCLFFYFLWFFIEQSTQLQAHYNICAKHSWQHGHPVMNRPTYSMHATCNHSGLTFKTNFSCTIRSLWTQNLYETSFVVLSLFIGGIGGGKLTCILLIFCIQSCDQYNCMEFLAKCLNLNKLHLPTLM